MAPKAGSCKPPGMGPSIESRAGVTLIRFTDIRLISSEGNLENPIPPVPEASGLTEPAILMVGVPLSFEAPTSERMRLQALLPAILLQKIAGLGTFFAIRAKPRLKSENCGMSSSTWY